MGLRGSEELLDEKGPEPDLLIRIAPGRCRIFRGNFRLSKMSFR